MRPVGSVPGGLTARLAGARRSRDGGSIDLPSTAGPYGRVPTLLLTIGAAILAIAVALAALQFVDQRPRVIPAFFVAAALCPLIFLRPAWILPVFLGFVWTSIGRDQLGGLSPVNYGSYLLLPAAAVYAYRRRDNARSVAIVAGLIGLPLLATSLLDTNGSVPTAWFKDLAFLPIAALCLRGADLERTIVVLAFIGIFLGLGAVYSVRVHPTSLFPLDQTDAVPGHPSNEAPRAAGPFGESNFFALSLAVLVPLALYLLGKGGWRVWLGLVSVLCLIAGIYSAGSRGGALAAAAGILATALSSSNRRVRWGSLVAVAAGGLLLLVFSAQASSSATRGVGGRATENRIGLAMFADHPLAGVGPERYPVLYRDYSRRIGNDPRYNRAPHSLPIEIAAEQGLIGLVGWLGAIIFLWRLAAARRVWQTALGRAVAVSLLAYLIGSIFLHGSQLRLLFILIGVLVVVCGRQDDTYPATRGAA